MKDVFISTLSTPKSKIQNPKKKKRYTEKGLIAGGLSKYLPVVSFSLAKKNRDDDTSRPLLYCFRETSSTWEICDQIR